jgi:hypothetical protein
MDGTSAFAALEDESGSLCRGEVLQRGAHTETVYY